VCLVRGWCSFSGSCICILGRGCGFGGCDCVGVEDGKEMISYIESSLSRDLGFGL
jgi:hypothetical protein